MKVEKIVTETQDLEIVDATLLAWEAEKLPMTLRRYNKWWWLRLPNMLRTYSANSYASVIYADGVVDYSGIGVHYGDVTVRPALEIKNLESSAFDVGDVFIFGGKRFEVINSKTAFCLEDIGTCAFREDWRAEDANNYETSDVKKFVDDWFEKVKQENG